MYRLSQSLFWSYLPKFLATWLGSDFKFGINCLIYNWVIVKYSLYLKKFAINFF